MISDPIAITRRWLREWVIAHNLCPFAAFEFDRQRVRYCCIDGTNTATLLERLAEECRHLDECDTTATTLLIVTSGAEDFMRYLGLVDSAESWLSVSGYEGIYQLASFHPDYLFADSRADRQGEDAADYSNRAPWPMLHLLRETGIEAALAHFPHPERIPQRNAEFLRARGADWCRETLATISDHR
ncbi:DUF1415 domain-containing protein [Kushneria aurantia]|uniref:DUF1415 domain-containing protein n=1 Tax=Kushneria aurantia TaxID=504092 RepID=A0ABV6G2Z4_9GAMM|nr:DUF1415 domain-containing protein [Kushneria aurantia]